MNRVEVVAGGLWLLALGGLIALAGYWIWAGRLG